MLPTNLSQREVTSIAIDLMEKMQAKLVLSLQFDGNDLEFPDLRGSGHLRCLKPFFLKRQSRISSGMPRMRYMG